MKMWVEDMVITLARHGATPTNELRLLVGNSEIGLSESGIEQARCLGKWAKESCVSKVICSDQVRAIETAAIVCEELQQSYSVDKNIRERDFGPFEGLSRDELIKRRTLLGLSNVSPTQDWDSSDTVESDTAIWRRAELTLRSIQLDQAGEHILLITHAGVLKAILHEVFQIPSTARGRFKFPNCCLVTMNLINNNWFLLEFLSNPCHTKFLSSEH